MAKRERKGESWGPGRKKYRNERMTERKGGIGRKRKDRLMERERKEREYEQKDKMNEVRKEKEHTASLTS